jgi:hypothetical protein
MRYLAALCIGLTLLLTGGCATLGIGQSDTATRILADVGCLAALAAAGVQVAGDPAVGGASTAIDVLGAITKIGTSSLPGTIMSACAQTLSWVAEDAQGALTIVKAESAAPEPVKAQLKAKAAKPGPKAPAPPVPTKVVIHLPS